MYRNIASASAITGLPNLVSSLLALHERYFSQTPSQLYEHRTTFLPEAQVGNEELAPGRQLLPNRKQPPKKLATALQYSVIQ